MVEDMAWDPHLALANNTIRSDVGEEEEEEEPVLASVRILGPEEPVLLERPAVNKHRNPEMARVVVTSEKRESSTGEDSGAGSTEEEVGKTTKSSCYQDFTPYLPEIKVQDVESWLFSSAAESAFICLRL
jgi:hypothetical protein